LTRPTSKQQYERQFKKWGFAKNSDTNTWKAINFKVIKRQKQGRTSAVYKQGRLLSAATVEKSRHRQGYLSVVEQCQESRLAVEAHISD
jgi:L-amino acid N-acyltransferase YncA